ncbi:MULTISPECIES: ABC transporter substrate-binding protein [Caldilinea]|jgi:putative spermidine/putrescine transport system substrate-binding protein|uniref:Putative ABC transporter substrate binding protein n=2 Tax=Caldilinea TaxID=233191 RepID=I0I3Y3_CALAS|nr:MULTISPECIES: ABC transporter substrate-binding protein [Caldilinea]MBO9392693.1 ABC transporter substrate-binding protein [Caldilinea sp.]BAL99970.1 putative ABC transporter substrate binding protein [Caldilinea aerophila DSM 14535 = NBRC 104270]GIV73361.1 MAG: spermidine/putrescine ABC transporter substrate-binding protein [Caldilinea sp.]
MLRISMIGTSILLIVALLLSACTVSPAGPTGDSGAASPAAPSSGGMKTEIGPGEGQVDIIAWAGYIERGETDPAYDWVTMFEEATGCKVNVKVAGTSDEMVTLMNQGGFDLVTASGDASLRLIAGGTVQPINIELIPSWHTIDERLQNAPWHTVDGVHYGTPYQWGANVLMYNTETFPEPPDTWGVIYIEQELPDGKSNKGRVQAYDGPIALADAALYLKTHRPELGIVDPYALTQEQYAAVLELARSQRQIVNRYWHDVIAQIEDFKNEGVVASSSWPFQVNLLKAEGAPIDSVIPKEGATGWADTTMMHVNAPHPNCAYMWMEHSLNPKVQGDLASWFGSVPAVPAGCQASELLGPDGCEINGFNNFDKISFWKTPTTKCPDGTDACVPYSQWVTDYIAIMGGN